MNYLTFDIDWAPDAVLLETVELLKKHNAKATFFATHSSSLIKELDKDPDFEIGIHPNFNKLLNGNDSDCNNYQQIVDGLKNIYPDAVGVRSHSLVQSTNILDAFVTAGLKYDVNLLLPYHAHIRPYQAWNGLLRLIYNWEDDIHWMYNRTFDNLNINLDNDTNIFDFHPIHIWLNTDCAKTYENAREHYMNPMKSKSYVNTTKSGARDALVYLLHQVPFTETLSGYYRNIIHV